MSFLYNAFKNAPAIGKKIKNTITGMKPTTGLTGKNQFFMDKMKKKLSKDTGEMIKFRNQKSKELFKNK